MEKEKKLVEKKLKFDSKKDNNQENLTISKNSKVQRDTKKEASKIKKSNDAKISKLLKIFTRKYKPSDVVLDKTTKKAGFFDKLQSVFFDTNEKQVEKLRKLAKKIDSLSEEYEKLTQEKLIQKTQELREKFQKFFPPDTAILMEKGRSWFDTAQGKKVLNFVIENIPECFAIVREAARRTSDHKHFEVQLMAGIALAQSRIIEFKTGEGKTLVAPLALFVYSLFGRGAYLVTVNDYLARRDAEWVGHMLGYLGITVGVVNDDKSYKYVDPEKLVDFGVPNDIVAQAKKIDWTNYSSLKGYCLVETDKKDAYNCDITYGTNSEFGFDYLRDNLQKSFEDMNQRDPFFCIIDEVDSILIDEARTPLIISRPSTDSIDLYRKFAALVKKLDKSDYVVNEKYRTVTLTESGIKKVESELGDNSIWSNPLLVKHLNRALVATYYYKKDVHYVVSGKEIIIVDEFTGRLQHGRRFSDGIHLAIEAKEGVEIKQESRVEATVTYQNYFRLFPILSGMTGTALTEAEEFGKIYNLDVVVIPTHRQMIRKDLPDVFYLDIDSKFKAIVKDIKKHYKKGQPVLVGTVSVEKSEKLAELLKKEKIPFELLNAKNHAREAEIVAKAGQKYAVTISTNMAGRGTDIKLGPGVRELGGLYVIGTERHESRRIDNQLRGRAGRQGDPGKSQFYLALDDDLMRIYGGDKIKTILKTANLPSDFRLEGRIAAIFAKTIQSAQRKVEAENFDVRKNLVDYDDVLNQQRLVVYERRRSIMRLFDEAKELYLKRTQEIKEDTKDDGVPEGTSRLRDYVVGKVKKYAVSIVDEVIKSDTFTKNDLELLLKELNKFIPQEYIDTGINNKFDSDYETYYEFILSNPSKIRLKEQISILVDEVYDLKEKEEGFITMREIEKYVLLQSIDTLWLDHLENMRDLRTGITLQGYAQRDPLYVYQNQGYDMFAQFMESVDSQVASTVLRYTSKIKRIARKEESKVSAKEAIRKAQEELEKAFLEAKSKNKKK